jgi:hypothetical protein
MEITSDLLQTIYSRANQFAITKFGSEPDRLELDSDGTITARWIDYRCGDMEEETEYISAENLTEDLDVVAAERAMRLEEERIKREAYEREQRRIREQREKEERKRQYEKLKKEFEN